MNIYKQLLTIYLSSLKNEISSYKDEGNLWKLSGSISNTPGNLSLHICGNLNHYIGALIGNTGYIRERDLEFSKKNVKKEALISEIEDTIKMIEKTLDGSTKEDLDKIYPDNTFGENVTYDFVFPRLVSHISYHLGQINYHRRIVE